MKSVRSRVLKNEMPIKDCISFQNGVLKMIVTNTDFVPGHEIKEILGVAIGNTVRAKHLGKDITAGLKSMIGGEIKQYTEMLTEARKESINRMINNAKEMNADAIINVRFMTSATMGGAAELLAYGTAVKLG